MRRSLIPLAVLAASACASGPSAAPDQGLRLDATSSYFRTDGAIDLELVNATDRLLGFNACAGLTLERWEDQAWQRVPHLGDDQVCRTELRPLEAGHATVIRQPVLEMMPEGRYRAWMKVDWPLGEGSRHLVTDPFRLGG